MEQFIGCDGHKKFSFFVTMNENGEYGRPLSETHAGWRCCCAMGPCRAGVDSTGGAARSAGDAALAHVPGADEDATEEPHPRCSAALQPMAREVSASLGDCRSKKAS